MSPLHLIAWGLHEKKQRTAAISRTGGGSDGSKPTLRTSTSAELALRALDDVLKNAAKRRQDIELTAFVRGVKPASSTGSTLPTSVVDETASSAKRVDPPSVGSDDRAWGLPLLLLALEGSSLPPPSWPPSESSAESNKIGIGSCTSSEGPGDVGGGRDRQDAKSNQAPAGTVRVPVISEAALRATVSAVRTCIHAAPADDQDALLSSLLSSLIPAHTPRTDCGEDSEDDASLAGAPEGGRGNVRIISPGRDLVASKRTLLPALAAVMGAVSLDSRALGAKGVATTAVPALLSAGLAEGAVGLEDAYSPGVVPQGCVRNGNRYRAVTPSTAPCCQCLAAVLNKLEGGPDLAANVALVIKALKEAFGFGVGTGEHGRNDDMEGLKPMDIDGEGTGDKESMVGPVQCLAWVTKAVAMRPGLDSTFSELLGMLCQLLVSVVAVAWITFTSRNLLRWCCHDLGRCCSS